MCTRPGAPRAGDPLRRPARPSSAAWTRQNRMHTQAALLVHPPPASAAERPMPPLRDMEPQRGVPVLTIALILLNVAVFVYSRRSRTTRAPAARRPTPASGAWCRTDRSTGRAIATPRAPPAARSTPGSPGSSLPRDQHVPCTAAGFTRQTCSSGSSATTSRNRLGRRFLPFYLLCGIVAGLGSGAGRHLQRRAAGRRPLSGAIAGVLGAIWSPGLRRGSDPIFLIFVFPLPPSCCWRSGSWFTRPVHAAGARRGRSDGVAHWPTSPASGGRRAAHQALPDRLTRAAAARASGSGRRFGTVGFRRRRRRDRPEPVEWVRVAWARHQPEAELPRLACATRASRPGSAHRRRGRPG